MPKYFVILHTVNETVNDFSKIKHNLTLMKTRFSTPKIFTGGVDIRHWNKLSAKEKKEALSKEWFVYYSFRDDKSGKLKRMPHVKGGANRCRMESKSNTTCYEHIIIPSYPYPIDHIHHET